MENPRKKPKSYGLVVERFDRKGGKEYLICKRRDSYYYGDIIRGRWKDFSDFKKLAERVEPEELERLKNNSFADLWKDFWIMGNSYLLAKDYDFSEKKFESIRSLLNVETISERESLWGFPKGRPNSYQEDNIVTAIREFCEETRIPEKYITLKGEKYQKEDYFGTDGKCYQTTYFNAIYFGPREDIEPLKFPDRIREFSHSEEIQEIRWVKKEDLARFLNHKKMSVIEGFETRSIFFPKERTRPKNQRKKYTIKNFSYPNRNP